MVNNNNKYYYNYLYYNIKCIFFLDLVSHRRTHGTVYLSAAHLQNTFNKNTCFYAFN